MIQHLRKLGAVSRQLATTVRRRVVPQVASGWMAAHAMTPEAQAAALSSIQLAWDRSPEADIATYVVRYGTSSGVYGNSIAAGKNTSVVINNLRSGITHYFVVAVRNESGLSSTNSAEISYTPVIQPLDGSITSPDDSITIKAGDPVVFSGTGTDPDSAGPLIYHWNFGKGSGVADSAVSNPGSQVFNRPGTYRITLTVSDSTGRSDPTPAVRTIIVKAPATKLISSNHWELKRVDSQDAKVNPARFAFDGDPTTFWESRIKKGKSSQKSHEIQIDMRKVSKINGFQYVPRRDGNTIGAIGRYKFYVSMDGKNWGKPAVSGVFEPSSRQKKVFFAPKRGRYLRLVSISKNKKSSRVAIAELKVYKVARKKRSCPPRAAPLSAFGNPSDDASGTGLIPANARDSARARTVTTSEVISGRKYLTLTVFKSLFRNDVHGRVQVSPDLVNWFSGKNHTTVLIDDDSILKVRDNTPVTRDSKRHIRLKSTPR